MTEVWTKEWEKFFELDIWVWPLSETHGARRMYFILVAEDKENRCRQAVLGAWAPCSHSDREHPVPDCIFLYLLSPNVAR